MFSDESTIIFSILFSLFLIPFGMYMILLCIKERRRRKNKTSQESYIYGSLWISLLAGLVFTICGTWFSLYSLSVI